MRPCNLIPLMSSLESLTGLGPALSKKFFQLGIKNVLSLLCHLPISFQKRHFISELAQAKSEELVTFQAKVIKYLSEPLKFKSAHGRPYRILVSDGTQEIILTFFKIFPSYIEKNLPLGALRLISGRVEYFQHKMQMTHPDFIGDIKESENWQGIEPIYALTQGITQKVMRKIMNQALDRLEALPEWISQNLLEIYDWKPWHTSLKQCHLMTDFVEEPALTAVRTRLAFDEFFANQLAILIIRKSQIQQLGHVFRPNGTIENRVIKSLTFQLTSDQQHALKEIDQDLRAPQRMVRLLQGDVGSGKTIVAFLTIIKAIESGFQTALLAPTEILVKQHTETMKIWAKAAGITVESLTGKDTIKTKREKYDQLQNGKIHLIIGTHALIQDAVKFHNLGLVVVDEQHRFGVEQRLALAEKGEKVEVLSMTATPIPRTLMLTSYGDLQCSYLRHKPSGRGDIQTKALSRERLTQVIEKLSVILQRQEKIYWICPLVEDSEVLDLAAAQQRYETLNQLFPNQVGLVHGRLKTSEKEEVMTEFKTGKIQILVATTVVEVGVHVEEATVMIIEHAERFGLAQLHQLRGRIGRGMKESTCILLYQSPLNAVAKARLNMMRFTTDGFKIAEEDLRLRGGGEALGARQSGLPNFHLVDFNHHQNLLELAHQESLNLLQQDPCLTSDQGKAARILLALFGRESATRYLQTA